MVPFDVDAVVRDLHARLHPNTEFLEAVLTGSLPQRRESDTADRGKRYRVTEKVEQFRPWTAPLIEFACGDDALRPTIS